MITFTWKVLEIKKGLIIIFLNNGVKEESEVFTEEVSILEDEDIRYIS